MSVGYKIPYYSPDALSQGFLTKSKTNHYAINGSMYGQKAIIGYVDNDFGSVYITYGLMDGFLYSTTTTDKTIIGAINELDARLKKIEAMLSGDTSENKIET